MSNNKQGDVMVPQAPVEASVDLRNMVRRYLISRSLKCMEGAAERRQVAVTGGKINEYRKEIQTAVRNFYGELPVGKNGAPLKSEMVSTFEKEGYRIENVLFDSFPGWEVNATVYVPLDYKPPFPAVVVAVGHSGKQKESYQLPCQFFARSGYLAIVFDPPGMAGEKRSGNCHFADGVRCYLTGETSSQYFIADALRCIDYLETRNDVDLSHGVAMTGVSGGGTTTTLANLLDDRVAVTGPSCCVTPLADLDITQCYCGCPETHIWGRYSQGIDETDLICAATPKPVLLMAGELDEVFRIDETRKLADQAKGFFEKAGVAEHFEFFVDNAGHCYSLAQAKEFVKFMNRNLLKDHRREMCELPNDGFQIDPDEQLKCNPRTDVNMFSLTLDKANDLEKVWDDVERIRQAAIEIAGVDDIATLPDVETGTPFQVWTHNWQQILLKPEEGIELPGTFLYPENSCPAGAVLHFDDQHRNRLLHTHGTMAKVMNYQKESDVYNLLSVDLRGWGDTAAAMYPYEMACWGSVDKYLAYTSAALGDSIMAMRIRDGLAALAYLRSRPEVNNDCIVITGCGLAAVVALHVALIDGDVKGVVTWDGLVSFKSLLESESYVWGADTFMPNVLPKYDLPRLVAAMNGSVSVLNSLDALGGPAPDKLLAGLNKKLKKQVYKNNVDEGALLEQVHLMFK